MKHLKYLLIGVYFGIVLVKGEVISWFRIQEMFHFQSFYMYGVIGSAVVIGAITVALIRAFNLRTVRGEVITLKGKPFNRVSNLVGGIIFGLGWAFSGACPGPLYALLGVGYWGVLLAIGGALLGTISYGYLKPHLPH